MKNINSFYALASVCVASLFLWSCGRAGGEFQGREFMPDMSHSIAYEANHNTYYYNHTWGDESEYRAMAGPRKPVDGTVARGYKPYKYENLEAFRTSDGDTYIQLRELATTAALADASITNPIQPASKAELEKVLAHGGELYNISCAVCHGEEGDGNGPIYNKGTGPYTAAPANYLKDEFINANDARYYNAIMHGKGMMQPHADKMNEEERWKVIHYIRYLQAESKGEDYFAKIGASGAEKVSLQESFKKLMEAASTGHGEAGHDDHADHSHGGALSIELDNVLYDIGKATLKSESSNTLEELASLLNANPGIKIEIGGHTDNTGDAAENLKLSEGRAAAVFFYLTTHGVDKGRLFFKGYGDTMPVADNGTEEGKKQNRRTEVKIVQ